MIASFRNNCLIYKLGRRLKFGDVRNAIMKTDSVVNDDNNCLRSMLARLGMCTSDFEICAKLTGMLASLQHVFGDGLMTSTGELK